MKRKKFLIEKSHSRELLIKPELELVGVLLQQKKKLKSDSQYLEGNLALKTKDRD